MTPEEKADLARRLEKFLGRQPSVHATAYVAPLATVVGDVRLGAWSSVWPSCVLRGDINYIEVGEGTNIQDGTVVHLADEYPAVIGRFVTVGHLAVVHACVVEDECLIGMHATILDGAVVGAQSLVGAGALVTKGMKIPPGSLVMGAPARVVRELRPEERAALRESAEKYMQVAEAHRMKVKGEK
ncbi:MAG: gamma carbonic anhydrase family protein [Opitutales bacterium]|jgi:carbonic anhydrase/acetyltransferase-like protein (isoleucine patch superfamily)